MRIFEGYRHGINFGGWFSQCDNSEERYDSFIKDEDFSQVALWGLDHVRIPIDYELVLNEDFSYKEKGIERIQRCIELCRDNGLNMILDLHKTPGFSFDPGEMQTGFFESEKYQQIFFDLWDTLAKRFGHNNNLAFELLNEVTDESYCDIWNDIASKAIEVIRKSSKDIPILVGGYHNNSVTAVKDLRLPEDDRLIYNFHCYNPLIFTHQGAYWIAPMDRGFRVSIKEEPEKLRGYGEKNLYPGYDDIGSYGRKIDETYFEELFKEAIEVAERKDVPLYCGEYGVIDLADPDDTLEWFRYISKIFEKYGIGRAVWSYREMDFGLTGEHYEGIRKELIKLL